MGSPGNIQHSINHLSRSGTKRFSDDIINIIININIIIIYPGRA